jgi:hypothetical protein
MILYSEKNNVDTVILAGDNIYSTPLEIQSDDDLELLKRGEKSSYDMDKQIELGFKNCMLPIKTNSFMVGVGNHDIETCEVLNKQINFEQWDMPALSYNVEYKLNDFDINFTFIDTNIYDDKWCQGVYPENAKDVQKRWLNNILSRSKGRWNIVIGHIPFICNPHAKEGKPSIMRKETALYEVIKENRNYIDLYMCADEHNQQYIVTDDMPPQVIIGSGGASQDEVCIVDELRQYTKLAQTTFGFLACNINRDILKLNFKAIAKSKFPDKQFVLKKY